MEQEGIRYGDEYISVARQALQDLRQRASRLPGGLRDYEPYLALLLQPFSDRPFQEFQERLTEVTGEPIVRLITGMVMGRQYEHPTIRPLLEPDEIGIFSEWTHLYGVALYRAVAYEKNPSKLAVFWVRDLEPFNRQVQFVRADGMGFDIVADSHDLIGMLETTVDVLMEMHRKEDLKLDNYDWVSLQYAKSRIGMLLSKEKPDHEG